MITKAQNLTTLLNKNLAGNFAGYEDVLYVYADDATTLVATYEWHTSSKRGFVVTGRRKGDTVRMTAWLDVIGVKYEIVPNTFLKVRQIVIAS